MNKKELVDKIALSADIPKVTASSALDCVISSVSEVLATGEDVALIGFGTFKVKERAARVGRNPKTGEKIQIKAAKVPTFTPSKCLKADINNK